MTIVFLYDFKISQKQMFSFYLFKKNLNLKKWFFIKCFRYKIMTIVFLYDFKISQKQMFSFYFFIYQALVNLME